MSDMHVIVGDGTFWSIIMHFPTPGGSNSVSVLWSNALVNSGIIGDGTSLPDGDGTEGTIDTTEKNAILAGTVFEHRAKFPLESGGITNPQLQATLRSFYTSEKTRVTAEIQRRLKYFGHTESET